MDIFILKKKKGLVSTPVLSRLVTGAQSVLFVNWALDKCTMGGDDEMKHDGKA